MKLMQSGSETNTIGEPISKLITESNNLEELKKIGLNIAEKMNKVDAGWVAQPPLENAEKWYLFISETCSLNISE